MQYSAIIMRTMSILLLVVLFVLRPASATRFDFTVPKHPPVTLPPTPITSPSTQDPRIRSNLARCPLQCDCHYISDEANWLTVTECTSDPGGSLDDFLHHHMVRDHHTIDLSSRPLHIELTRANLSYVPAAICNMSWLASLDISENNIEVIPWGCLSKLKFLRHINVSYNIINGLGNSNSGGFRNISWFDFSYNLIWDIASGFFTIPLLGSLYISQNSLIDLPWGDLSRLKYLKHIDASYNNLRVINSTGVFRELKLMNLNHNHIVELTDESFNTPSLTQLFVSGNGLKTFPWDRLSELKYLRHIDASNNSLTLLEKKSTIKFRSLESLKVNDNRIINITDGFFTMPNLLTLDISSNNLTGNFWAQLSQLRYLEHVDISFNDLKASAKINRTGFKNVKTFTAVNCNISRIEDVFFALPALTDLNVSGNILRSLPWMYLSKLGHLRSINASHNLLTVLETGEPGGFRKLTTLDLHGNRILTITKGFFMTPLLRSLDVSQNHLEGLPWDRLSELGFLESIDASYNNIVTMGNIRSGAFTRLKILDVSNNHISKIEERFLDIPLLTSLAVPENRLKHFPWADLSKLESLTYIDASYNELTALKNYDTGGFRNLTFLNVRDNHITAITDGFFSMPSLTILDVSDNRLRTLPWNALSELDYLESMFAFSNELTSLRNKTIGGFKRLKTLEISNNHIVDIEEGFLDIPSLNTVVMARNRLKQLPWADLSKLQFIDASGNRITELGNNDTKGFKYLTELDVRSNHIATIAEGFFSTPSLITLRIGGNRLRTLSWRALSKLDYLEHIDASSNKFTILRNNTIGGFKRLRILQLSSNRISEIEEGFLWMPSLRELYISNNRLGAMPWRSLSELEYLNIIFASSNKLSVLGNKHAGGFKGLESFIVAFNQISKIDEGFLSMPSLISLDISGNRLQRFPWAELKKLEKLGSVDVSYNHLTTLAMETVNEFSPNVTYINLPGPREYNTKLESSHIGFKNLRTLSVSDNVITRIEEGFFSTPLLKVLYISTNNLKILPWAELSKLSFCEEIHASNNQLTVLENQRDKGLTSLTSLTILDLSSNHITIIDKAFFNFPSLKNLEISLNKLRTFPWTSLSKLKQLEYIDVSGNHLNILENYSNGRDAGFRQLRSLSVNDNNISWIDTGFFNTPSLRYLDISGNKLNTILSITSSILESLRILKASDNALTYLDRVDWKRFRSLTKVDLSNNHISTVAEEYFRSPVDYSIRFELSHNALTDLDISWLKYCNSIILDYNNITDAIRTSDLETTTELPSCRNVDKIEISLKHNEITSVTKLLEGFLSVDEFLDLIVSKNYRFDLRDNPGNCDGRDINIYRKSVSLLNFRRRPWVEKSLDIIKQQTLCVTSCPEPCICSVVPSRFLIDVNCTQQSLTRLPSELPSLPDRSFMYRLFFDGNNIESIDDHNYWGHVHTLSLYDNKVENVSVAGLNALVNLRVLDLGKNDLVRLPRNISMVNLSSEVTLRLSDNPWSCDCQILETKHWILENLRSTQNESDFLCAQPVALKQRNLLSVSDARLTCGDTPIRDNRLTVIISVVTFGALFIVNTLAIYVIYRRWCKSKQLKWHPTDRDECHGENKEYDIFLSYANEDEEYVEEYLIPGLEMRGYKVCFHRQDFVPGESIVANIENAIMKSKRTLVYISEAFNESGFCRWEFDAAFSLDLDSRRNRLVAVTDADLNIDALDPNIKSYLSRFTYVERDSQLFWENVLSHLPVEKMGGEGNAELDVHPGPQVGMEAVGDQAEADDAGRDIDDDGLNNVNVQDNIQLVPVRGLL